MSRFTRKRSVPVRVLIGKILSEYAHWYTAADFPGLIKRERNRSDRSGEPVTYVQFYLRGNLGQVYVRNPRQLRETLKIIVSLVEQNTRDYEPRILFDEHHMGVLLLATSLGDATPYIHNIANKLILHITKKDDVYSALEGITISSYPLHQFLNYRRIEVSPFFSRQIQFSKASSSKIQQVHKFERAGEKKGERSAVSSVGSGKTAVNLAVEGTLFETPRKTYGFFKRMLDIIGSALGIVFFAPVMVVIAILIKITSRGPVIFRQERVGYRGKKFLFLKFRTMWMNNNDEIHRDYVRKLIEGKNGQINFGTTDKPLYKLENDPRITPLGHFLRQFSLDELPQFFNVLMGRMSLVGPRPPIPYEIDAYQKWHYRRILEVKPGITGLWQVYGRSMTTFDEMVRLDLKYVQNRSLLLDLKILLRTIRAVFNTTGAL